VRNTRMSFRMCCRYDEMRAAWVGTLFFLPYATPWGIRSARHSHHFQGLATGGSPAIASYCGGGGGGSGGGIERSSWMPLRDGSSNGLLLLTSWVFTSTFCLGSGLISVSNVL
jgi:hypothetical protein